MCCENVQDLTRLETHDGSKTTNTLIIAKSTNAYAATQKTAEDNEFKLKSKARQPWVFKVEVTQKDPGLILSHICVYLQLILSSQAKSLIKL